MSKISSRHILRIFSCLIPLVLLSGCSNNPYPPGESSKSVLYRTIGELPRDLDPTKSNFELDQYFIGSIYPTYFKYDYLKHDHYTLVLNLGGSEPKREPYHYSETVKGKSVPKVGESWTFHIRPGLHFQDDPCFPGGKGREILASDFLYSFKRMADPTLNCPNVSFIGDKILGFSDYMDYCTKRWGRKLPMDYSYSVTGLQLDPKDPYSFRVLLNQPYPQLRYLMAVSFTTPLAHEAVDKYGDLDQHPVGCGQYVMSELVPKQRWILKVNPNRPVEYYPSDGTEEDRKAGLLADAGKRLPLNDEIDTNFVAEGVTSWNLFLQGYVDSSGVGSTNFNQIVSKQGKLSPEMVHRGISMLKSADPGVRYYIFNMTDPVIGGYTPEKRKLRQAVSCAIDPASYIDLFYQGLGVPGNFIIPPGLFGYDANYHNPYTYNLAHAKQLLAEAGYPGGIDSKTGERLTLYFDCPVGDSVERQTDAWVQKQLAAIGITLVIRPVREIDWMMNSEKGRFQIERWGWIADYPDPEDFLMLLYGHNNRQVNPCGYKNSEYDKLYEQVRSMDDGPARLALIKRMRDISVEDCPLVYYVHDEALYIHQKWEHNVDPNPIAYDSPKYIRIDGPVRGTMQAEWNKPNYWPLLALAVTIYLVSIPAGKVVSRRKNRHIRKKQESD